MKVLVSDPIAKEGIEILKAQSNVDVKTGLKPEELLKIIGEYDALVVRSETKVTAEVMEAGKKLQVVARAGVGLDNVDVKAATQKGIVVVYSPTGNTISACEHTMALMLSLSRHVPQANAKLKQNLWQRSEFTGTELRNKTLGVIGLGNVGSEVARRSQAFNMKILAYDPMVSEEFAKNLDIQLAPLEKIFKEADFITLHIPLNEATKGIIGPKEFAMMKPSVRIINCARGGLIDEQELYDAVESGKIAGAAVDVFSKEPATDNILLKSDKIIVTPHLGASTAEAQVGVAIDAAEQVLAVLRGEPAKYAINAPQISAELMKQIGPFIKVAATLGKLGGQLMEGQIKNVEILYCGELSAYDSTPLKASIIGGLLEESAEERINMVNYANVAARRGIKITEKKEAACENYPSSIDVAVTTDKGVTKVAGTVLRGETHVTRIDDYFTDIMPSGRYFLFADHRDRPGMIGAMGMITGRADVNISAMMLARQAPRGRAMVILSLDEPLPEKYRKEMESLPEVNNVRVVQI
jgi:D-3-phosphoglycerate dehydrogenase / 2-oxoglutarate reductase